MHVLVAYNARVDAADMRETETSGVIEVGKAEGVSLDRLACFIQPCDCIPVSRFRSNVTAFPSGYILYPLRSGVSSCSGPDLLGPLFSLRVSFAGSVTAAVRRGGTRRGRRGGRMTRAGGGRAVDEDGVGGLEVEGLRDFGVWRGEEEEGDEEGDEEGEGIFYHLHFVSYREAMAVRVYGTVQYFRGPRRMRQYP